MTTEKIIIVVVLLFNMFLTVQASITIPFKFVGKLIVIQANINGVAGNYILDTGTPNLVLNTRYFDGTPTNKVFHGINSAGGRVEVSHLPVKIGTQTWDKVYAEIIPMSHIERAKGIPIHGLIGSKLFKNQELQIDFQNMKIVLLDLDRKGEKIDPDNHVKPYITIPFQWKGATPCIEARVGDEKIKLTVDTGAEINMLSERYLKKLDGNVRNIKEKYLGGFGKAPKKVSTASISNIQMNNHLCASMQTVFTSIAHLNQSVPGPVVDGIIGYEFLSQFRTAINFKKREIYLWHYLSREDTLLASKHN